VINIVSSAKAGTTNAIRWPKGIDLGRGLPNSFTRNQLARGRITIRNVRCKSDLCILFIFNHSPRFNSVVGQAFQPDSELNKVRLESLTYLISRGGCINSYCRQPLGLGLVHRDAANANGPPGLWIEIHQTAV